MAANSQRRSCIYPLTYNTGSDYVIAMLLTFLLLTELCYGSFQSSECLVHFKDGDFILGGIIPIYSTVNQSCDGGMMARHGVPKVEAMVYAIDKINKQNYILPNTTLGYEIRNDCREEDTSLWSTITMSDPCGETTFQRHCAGQQRNPRARPVSAIIGPGSSATSLFVSRAATIYAVPTIAYSASSDELSDTNKFPFFFRTVPPDKFQAAVMIDLLLRYNWKYIALYYSIDSYGTNGARRIRLLAQKTDICIAINKPIPHISDESEWTDVISNLQNSPHIKVAVVFSLSGPASLLLTKINAGNLNRRLTFVGSDDVSVGLSKLGPIAHGSLFVRVHSNPDEEFRSHWNQLESGDHVTSPWYSDFSNHWKSIHNCERMSTCPFPPLSESTIINGVFAFALALHSTISNCPADRCRSTVDGQILNNHLREVSFQTSNENMDTFKFYGNGAVGKYDIFNLQKQYGQYVLHEIGRWDMKNNFSQFQEHEIQWGAAENLTDVSPPVSLCEEICEPGHIVVYLEKRCCKGCQACPNNSIVANGTECKECPFKQWPNSDYTTCELMKPQYLKWHDPAVILITLLSCIGILLTISVAIGMYEYRDHRLIKATSKELSFVIICGLLLTFVTQFILVVPPSNVSCMVSEILKTFSILLIYGPTLLKVVRIYRIFRTSRKSVSPMKFVLPADQVWMLMIIIAIQVIISVLSLILGPSKPHYIEASLLQGSLNLYCRYGYGFLASVTYNLILIITCCYFAFRTRKVPSNYNESRFIAISVYSTLVICLSSVPVYFTATSVTYKVATISAALLMNAYLTLVLLFLPKIYAVKFLGSDVNVDTWRMSTVAVGSVNRFNDNSVSAQ